MAIALPKRVILLVAGLSVSGCATVRQVTEALVGVERLRFRLHGVSDFRIVGIPLAEKKALTDFSPVEAAQLVSAYQARRLPAELTLELAVDNPNDGRQGRRRLPITISTMRWRLFIDEIPTVSGELAQPVEIPASGETTVVPLRVQLDLYQFFGQRRYEELLQLALAIGGKGGSPSRIALDIEPVLSTPLGALRYPQPIRVVDKEFRP